MEDRLSQEEFDNLYKKGYVFKSNTPEKIYSNYVLFANSLEKNYVRTINALINYNFDDVKFSNMDVHTSEQIYNILINNKFCVSDSKYYILKYNPLLLIASLENDYDKTINLLVRKNKNDKKVKIPSFKNENEKLLNVLLEKGFVFNKENLSLIKVNSSFLIASLKNNVDKTFKALNKLKYIDDVLIDDYQMKETINYLFIEKKIKFDNLPSVIKNYIVDYISFNYIFDGDEICYFVNNNYIPITYLSNGCLLHLFNDLDEISKYDQKTKDFIYGFIYNDKYKKYCLDDELKLIEYLGQEYRGCKTIENVLVLMHKNNLKRDNMNILEMLAIQMYGMKEEDKNLIKKSINVFSYGENKFYTGNQQGNLVELYINANCSKTSDMILTIIHEICHSIQIKNIQEGNIVEDNDIDVYSKDFILRLILGDEYYSKNYFNMSFEYDASVKSCMKLVKLLGMSDIDYETKKLEVLRNNALKVIKKAEEKDEKYEKNMYRNNVNINDLFEEEMKKIKNNNLSLYTALIYSYPVIRYEYNYEKNFTRKTIEQLIDELRNSDEKKDKGIYYNILQNRLNYEKDELAEENFNEIKSLLKTKKYDDKTKKMLNKLLEVCFEKKNEKYVSYFYKSGGNKR